MPRPLAAEPLAHDERTVVMVLPPTWWGSPPKPEQLDPEDVGALLPPFYARLRTEPKRFGGTVGKVHRDAVMALFGAPVAHEDDLERAVRSRWRSATGCAMRSRSRSAGGEHGEALAMLGQGEGLAAGDVAKHGGPGSEPPGHGASQKIV